MKRNKLSLFLVTLASGFLLCQNAGAFAIVTEEFINYQTGELGNTATGANGGNIPSWNTAQPSVNVTNGSGSLNGLTNGLVASAGDKVYISATNNLSNAPYLKFVNPGTYTQTVATNVYYSFLYKFDSGFPLASGGQKIAQANKQNSGYTSSGNVTKWMVHARDLGSGQINLGISKYPNPGTLTNWATTNLAYNQVFFVVVKEKITSLTSNEVESLWINPNTNTMGVAEPTPAATAADGVDDTSSTGVGRFMLPSTGQQAEFDELRIGNNWVDVTPPAGQCLAATISANPINATNVEGLNASFFVTAPCTDPTYQWQNSQNSGVTWNNISGANTYNYTTPTLWISSNQGEQFRCVVTTPCDSLSATSGVATVTLNVATATPVGLVMYDDFSDDVRDNTPVATNNSVWHTSSTYTGNLDATTGALIGTPVSGSSTLWLGYFVNETSGVPSSLNPIALNVTNAIVVTLPFTVGTMDSHTNNGDMRFGLYDYADGGTLITNDTTAAGGSSGNGINVRGYMLSLDFGTNFTVSAPLSLWVRDGLNDINLMGTEGDYLAMGGGPNTTPGGGGYTNAPAFQPGGNYTLVFQVTRTDTNTCRFTTSITGVNYAGVSTNWTYTALDTNGLAYHRFDSFAMRPNSLEETADYFTFPYFEVQVVPTAWEIQQINPVTVTRTGTSATLNWTPIPTGVATFSYSVQKATQLLYTNTVWTTLTTNLSSTTYTDTSATASNSFYRVHSP